MIVVVVSAVLFVVDLLHHLMRSLVACTWKSDPPVVICSTMEIWTLFVPSLHNLLIFNRGG